MANLLTESLRTLTEAGRLLPAGRNGRPVTLSCVLRWVQEGAPGPDGRMVRLEAVRVGGRWLTSVEALARWADRLTPRFDREPAPTPRTPTARSRESQRAAERLEAAGI